MGRGKICLGEAEERYNKALGGLNILHIPCLELFLFLPVRFFPPLQTSTVELVNIGANCIVGFKIVMGKKVKGFKIEISVINHYIKSCWVLECNFVRLNAPLRITQSPTYDILSQVFNFVY